MPLASAHGFLLSEGTFTTIDVPGSDLYRGHGINDAGQIVGRFHRCATWASHGFLLSEGTFTTIDVPGGTCHPGLRHQRRRPDRGRLQRCRDRLHGFLLSEGTFTTIDVPASDRPTASTTRGRS